MFEFCLESKLLSGTVALKTFWWKVNDLENKYRKLWKNHNRKCSRGGIYHHNNLTMFLDAAFYKTSDGAHSGLTPLQHINASQSISVCVNESFVTECVELSDNVDTSMASHQHPAQCRYTTPVVMRREKNTPQHKITSSSVAIQVSSPQITTEGQLRRDERKCRRCIFLQDEYIGRLQDSNDIRLAELAELEEKKNATEKTLKQKQELVRELTYKCKRLAADCMKHQINAKRCKDEVNQHHCISDAVLTDITVENENLMSSNLELEKTLSAEQIKTRTLQKRISRLKRSKEDSVCTVIQLCNKLSNGGDSAQCVMDICEEVASLGNNTAMLKTLTEAISSNIKAKTKNAYSDHIALLIMELQTLGVSQSAVGDVMNACSKHLCGRVLDHHVSRRTAGRMVRRGGILSDIQVAMELQDSASKGLRVGQDTTTRRGTEHVSTIWGIKNADGQIKYLQARVGWLPNHTADEQSKYILNQLHGFNELLTKLDLPQDKQLSIAHVVEFIGDHVNDKLHRNLEREHLLALQCLTDKQAIPKEEQERLKFLYKSACQQHSCAKVSRAFFDGMQTLEPPDLAPSIGKYGLQQKKGRTYEAASAKVIEFASMQLSPDYANTSSTDYNWADVYHGWCTANHKPYQRIGYVNKNRHYRHEYEARKIVQTTDSIVQFYESRRSTRDDLNNHQTLRNKDQVVFESLKHKEVQAQLVAADAMRFAFYSPFLVMVKSTEVDVLTVGQHIREAYKFLFIVSTEDDSANKVLHGETVLFGGHFGDDFTKPVGLSIYGEDMAARAGQYLKAGCAAAADALKKISHEYFDGGQYAEPTHHMTSVLSGREAHTDRNEGNFGQLSQQMRKEPNARLQTLTSKVAMRANNTINTVRENSDLMRCIHDTRKLERDESSVTIKSQLANLAAANEHHLQEMRETVARRQTKRTKKQVALLCKFGKMGKLSVTGTFRNYARNTIDHPI